MLGNGRKVFSISFLLLNAFIIAIIESNKTTEKTMNIFSFSICEGDFSKTEVYKTSTYAHIPTFNMSSDSELDLIQQCRFELNIKSDESLPHNQFKSGYLFIIHSQIYIVDNDWEAYAKLNVPKTIPRTRDVILPFFEFILNSEIKSYKKGLKAGSLLARNELKNWLNAC